MNSLVLGILIISSVLSLGYGTDLTFSLNNLYNQKAEVYPLLEKSEAKTISVPIKNDSMLSLSILVKSEEKVISAPIKNDSMLSLPLDYLSDSLYNYKWEVYLSATEWQWRVRKPGIFSSKVLNCWVRSSRDVLVDFQYCANPTEIPPNPNGNSEIAVWFAITFVTSQLNPPPRNSYEWKTAQQLNNSDFIITAPVMGKNWYLWSMIEVTNQNRAAEYQNSATITFSLQGVEDWIEPEISLERKSNR
jgi:hypothetical protein